MASKETRFKSKISIQCSNCKVSMRRDRLSYHTRQQHPGLPIKERDQTSLTDILSRKRPHDRENEGESNPTAKRKKTDGADETQSGSTAATSEVQVEQIATEIQSADSVTSNTQQPEEPYHRRNKAAESESPNSEINVKFDAILKKLADIKLTANKKSVVHKPGEYDEVSAVKILVQSSKSAKRFGEIAKLTIDVHNNMLICGAFSTDVSVRLRCGAGLFNYDFALGIDFAERNQPVGFVNFKKSIARHGASETHQANLARIGEESEHSRKLAAKQQSIGITVGKQAYRLLKYRRPLADFEVDLLLLAHANAKIGNLNHSRKFPSELRPVFAKVIKDRLMEYLAQPLDATSNLPPLGIVADKLTTRRRSGQMFCRYPVYARHA